MKTGANEYGMKRYVMAFLKRGPNQDRTKADELQRLHMANIGRLADGIVRAFFSRWRTPWY
ncbi:hypothetical protein GCM10009347_10350 [Shewanella algicola]|uniref:Uncharacterized protein n=1 Tax=Shewanella algicola TaxID=640633 RepID=A0A9X2CA69_9GAMM|nr:hypothetical protein [Shewanella algicola]MCL1104529.1 hypothetical protein [Shewanella algicola]GGP44718.1 hypothetical protein GCM10009347_10350 [Shewanella algicola]